MKIKNLLPKKGEEVFNAAASYGYVKSSMEISLSQVLLQNPIAQFEYQSAICFQIGNKVVCYD